MKRAAILPAILLVPLCLAVAGCNEQSGETAPPVRPVLSQVVEPGHVRSPQFVGVVAARVSVAMSFRVGGTLATRNVEVGSQVKAGAKVATLDATTSELAVENARASLASAQVQYANAADAEARLRTLNQSDVVAISNLEQAEQQTAGARASLVQAQARYDQAVEQLSYATLTAPFDGIVTAVGAEPGSVVGAGQTVVTLADPLTRDLVIDLPEAIVNRIAVGTTFHLSPQLAPQVKVEGKVREISPQANQLTRSWRIKIGIDSETEQFWLGTTATASLEVRDNGALTVPQTAVRDEGGKTSVFVVDEKEAAVRARPVTLGDAAEGRVIVLSGVEAGERVVVAGVNSLSDGQKIKLEERTK